MHKLKNKAPNYFPEAPKLCIFICEDMSEDRVEEATTEMKGNIKITEPIVIIIKFPTLHF